MSKKDSVPTMHQVCANCGHQTMEQLQGQIVRQMVCHRMPPTISMVSTPQGIQGMTMFPVVQPTMYCHEWRGRTQSIKCDGNHGGPACTDSGCWQRTNPVIGGQAP
jgi:hypothetical protein